MTLSKEQILATSIPQEAVDVPEWGGKVNIRGLSASERDDYEQSLVEVGPDGRTRVKKTQHNVRASLVARCLVDEAGKRLFTDADVAALGEKSARPSTRCGRRTPPVGHEPGGGGGGARGFRARPGHRQLYRLALALGIPPTELAEHLSGHDLAEWAAFERLHGPLLVHERIDVAAAMVCAVMANVMGGGKRFEPRDFLPKWGAEPQSDEHCSPSRRTSSDRRRHSCTPRHADRRGSGGHEGPDRRFGAGQFQRARFRYAGRGLGKTSGAAFGAVAATAAVGGSLWPRSRRTRYGRRPPTTSLHPHRCHLQLQRGRHRAVEGRGHGPLRGDRQGTAGTGRGAVLPVLRRPGEQRGHGHAGDVGQGLPVGLGSVTDVANITASR